MLVVGGIRFQVKLAPQARQRLDFGDSFVKDRANV
jgi:hypothetical protein